MTENAAISAKPAISVIVPVFNMEPFVRECLSSLCRQSMNEIEIIIIDDGSEDCSASICDEYASRNKHMRVAHTANHGLSAARNLGISMAEGEWLMFVDSDDYVSPDFCRIPYETAIRENADMIIFQRTNIGAKNKRRRKPYGRIDHEQAVDHGEYTAWNKLYRATLFEGIRFPEGMNFEDVFTTHRLIYRAENIVLIPDRLYFYRYRPDSICHIKTEKNKRDAFTAHLQRHDDIISFGYPREKADLQMIEPALSACVFLKTDSDGLLAKAESILDSSSCIPRNLALRKKLMLILRKHNRRLFRIVCDNCRLSTKELRRV